MAKYMDGFDNARVRRCGINLPLRRSLSQPLNFQSRGDPSREGRSALSITFTYLNRKSPITRTVFHRYPHREHPESLYGDGRIDVFILPLEIDGADFETSTESHFLPRGEDGIPASPISYFQPLSRVPALRGRLNMTSAHGGVAVSK